MNVYTWLNGQAHSSLSLLDRGVQYGDSIFTTLRARAGRLLDWPNHWQRLQQTARRWQLHLPNKDLITQELTTAAQTIKTGGIKYLLTRGEGRGYAPAPDASVNRLLYAWPEALPWRDWRQGVAAVWNPTPWQWPNPCPGMKTGQSWPMVVAALHKPLADFPEAMFEQLFADPQGQLLSGNRSNVFLYFQKQWWTPPITDYGIAGITRRFCLQKFADYAWPHQVQALAFSDLLAAEEVLLTNAIFGVVPLRALYAADGRLLRTWQPQHSRLLQDSYLFCL
jgi:4-amino-4-deoxychorismate lyase